jgi:hypothetical protein
MIRFAASAVHLTSQQRGTMHRADVHQPRSRHWPRHAIFLLLPACFHTEYLQDDAGVGGDDGAGHDAASGDGDAAVPPDALTCPPGYDVVLPSEPSRYRLIKTGARGWEQSAACANDSHDATHLAVVETTAEIASIQMLVEQHGNEIAGTAVLIGGVQLNTATMPGESWLGFDDLPLISNAWSVGTTEPNDADGMEDTGASIHKEQFISIAAGKSGLNDADGGDMNNLKGALCECDGHRMAPNAATAVDSYRKP